MTGVLLALSSSMAVAGSTKVVVLDSTVAEIHRDQELTHDQLLNIPSGNHLLVGLVEGRKLKQVDMQGPQKGTVEKLMGTDLVLEDVESPEEREEAYRRYCERPQPPAWCGAR
jgi:hypothetical protein